MNSKKLCFLHIPKTAGQSVFNFLASSFPNENVCPYRTESEYRKTGGYEEYIVHSGHIDWTTLEKMSGEKIYFTVLRKPIDRILSFYFYLLREARKLDKKELELPENTGMNAIISLTPDEYFCDSGGELRQFIDDHFDNFYTYYFAGKKYNSRRKMRELDNAFLIKKAMANLINEVHGIYTINNWQEVTDLINSEFEINTSATHEYKVNVGDGLDTKARLKYLGELGATQKTYDRLNDMVLMDDILYDSISRISQL